MEFVDVAYAYLAPLLLLLSLFLRRQQATYFKSTLAAMNVSLVFFVISAGREYYGLYQLAKAFGFNVTPQGLLRLASSNIPYFAKNVLVLLLPFLFLFKKLSANTVLTILMIVLLWYDVVYSTFTNQPCHLIGSNYAPYLIPILRYSCLLTGMYSFLWLIKRLPIRSA